MMARDPEQTDSVYDFLYIDSRRIALFLSQFSQFGHLTALTRSASQTDASSTGLAARIIKADDSETTQKSQTQSYDTQWVAPLSFLDAVYQRGMIARDLGRMRIGSLALITGTLALFDMSALKGVWDMSYVQTMLTRDIQIEKGENRKTQISLFKAMFDMIKSTPHGTIATFQSADGAFWSSLQGDNLLLPAADILIKHGIAVEGEWNVVGILDAYPDSPDAQMSDKQERAANSLGGVGDLVNGLLLPLKELLGRPAGSYGVTPLLIFRTVVGSG